MLTATLLALAAAVLHAGWNLWVKQSGDRWIALWGQMTMAGIGGIIITAIVGLPPHFVWWPAVASGLIHLYYIVALARSYDLADFSVTYPIARGTGALLAAVGGVMFLNDHLSPLMVLGILVAIGGIMRVLSCRVPAPAFERLRIGDGSVIERAQSALDAGFQAIDAGMTLPLSSARWRGFTRPLALTVDGDTYLRLRDIAGQSFDDDMRDAAGWLIARGVGVSVTNVAPVRPVAPVAAATPTATPTRPTPLRPLAPVPTASSAVRPLPVPAASTATDNESTTPPPPPGPIRKERVIEAIRARATPRAALPPDDSAPDGDELRRRREAVGISQRDLAAASGLSRGLVAEVERGRRRHVMTRARIAETLASVAAEKGISLDTGTSVAV